LRRIASDLRAHLDERRRLEEEVARLRGQLESPEATKRECDLILKKARRQAERITSAAEKDTVARIEALRRVEKVHGLVRTELRRMLGAMLDAVNAPSDAIGESLKNHELARDLERVTAAAEAGTAVDEIAAVEPTAAEAAALAGDSMVASPDTSAESGMLPDAAGKEQVRAPSTSPLVDLVTGWTARTRGR
jgi:cell division septum initiation protein DivIVA